MKKILLITPEYPPHGSGIGNVVSRLRTELETIGIGVDLISRGSQESPRMIVESKLPGIAGLIPFWERVTRLALMRKGDYDLIWMHAPLLINARHLASFSNLMISFHSSYVGSYQALKSHQHVRLLPYYGLASKIQSRFLRELSRTRNTTITAVSPSVADELYANGLDHPVQIVPNGIGALGSDEALESGMRVKLLRLCNASNAEDERILIYSGRITEVKQIGLLLRLFGQIRSLRPKTHFLVLGSGNLLCRTKKQAALIPNVHILGSRQHAAVMEVLEGADAFISLSCYEGLPLAVLEAASHRLPLILSDIPAHRYISSRFDNPTVLLNSRDPDPAQVVAFLDRIRRRIGAGQGLPPEFAWDNIVRSYLNLVRVRSDPDSSS
jgi:glycosyltransferase involved in cell wall biosynthesis